TSGRSPASGRSSGPSPMSAPPPTSEAGLPSSSTTSVPGLLPHAARTPADTRVHRALVRILPPYPAIATRAAKHGVRAWHTKNHASRWTGDATLHAGAEGRQYEHPTGRRCEEQERSDAIDCGGATHGRRAGTKIAPALFGLRQPVMLGSRA